MKKLYINWKIILFSFILFLNLYKSSFVNADNSDGFKKINNNSFICDNRCSINLGNKGNNDYLNISGDFTGIGKIGYSLSIGEYNIFGQFYEINGQEKIDQNFLFENLHLLSTLGNNTKIILMINGKIEGKNYKFSLGKTNSITKLNSQFNNFLEVETLNPFSINQRKSPFIGNIKLTIFLYISFCIIAFVLFFFKKFRNKQSFIYLFLIFFSILFARQLFDYTSILNNGLKDFTYNKMDEKTYFDLGDYISFTDKIRKTLNLDNEKNTNNCNIYIYPTKDVYLATHWRNVYLKPCTIVNNEDESNYGLYYKTKNFDNKGKILIDFNGSYLIKY